MRTAARIMLALAAFLAGGAAARAAELEPLDSIDVALVYRLVTETFYRPIDGRAVIEGARRALDAYAKSKGVADAALPEPRAPRDTGDAFRQIDADILATARRTHDAERGVTFVALDGMARATGDRYTEFLTPEKLRAFNAPLDPDAVSGVGVLLQIDEPAGYPRAFYVSPKSPAENAGLRTGDLIVEIGGVATRGYTIERTRALLRGARGTPVAITVKRDGQTLAPMLATRGDVRSPTVLFKLLPGNIGYIDVLVFGAPTAAEFNVALARLQAADARAYVVDLRNNGGGYVTAAVAIANRFIGSGPIVSEIDRRNREVQTAADGTAIARKPLAVLINGSSASASEIAAGALHDAGLATLVGTRSFGKGVEQQMTTLPGGVALKITTGKYLTPGRHDLDKVGIEPDRVVQASKNPRFAEPSSDAQLDAAYALLQQKIAAAN